MSPDAIGSFGLMTASALSHASASPCTTASRRSWGGSRANSTGSIIAHLLIGAGQGIDTLRRMTYGPTDD